MTFSVINYNTFVVHNSLKTRKYVIKYANRVFSTIEKNPET